MRVIDVTAALWDFFDACALLEQTTALTTASLKDFYGDRLESIGVAIRHIEQLSGFDAVVLQHFTRTPWATGVGKFEIEQLAGTFALRLGLKRIPTSCELPRLAKEVAENSLVAVTHYVLLAHRVHVGPFQPEILPEVSSLLESLVSIGSSSIAKDFDVHVVVQSWKKRREELLGSDRKILSAKIITDLLML